MRAGLTHLNRKYCGHHIVHDFVCKDTVVDSILICLAFHHRGHVDYIDANDETSDTECEEDR